MASEDRSALISPDTEIMLNSGRRAYAIGLDSGLWSNRNSRRVLARLRGQREHLPRVGQAVELNVTDSCRIIHATDDSRVITRRDILHNR
jgi:hypothetical protein